MNISLQNVSFSYTDDMEKAVLRDLNLEIHSGECVVLAGESGCGKTTLSKLLNGLIPHYNSGTLQGKVLLGDRETKAMSLAEISTVVGSVFQNPRSQFFNINTTEELAFGCENRAIPPAEIRERMDRVIREFHLENLVDRNIFHLSGGEKQRIACASVAATEPEIFVLDEPSANLDLYTIGELQKIIELWKAKGKTIFVVEHRLHYLRNLATRICYLKDGRIEREFTPQELESKGPAFTASLGLRCMNLNTLETEDSPAAAEKSAEKAENSAKGEVLTFENLTFAYQKKFPVLNISRLELPKGKITALIGLNGAGKSTLAQILCGLQGSFKQKRAAKKLGTYLIMQDVNHQLFTESVLDEVLLSMEEENEDQAFEILKSLNLGDYKDEHPLSLSGGQKQRVAIASGVACERDVIVFDEPTSGLDYKQMLAVSKILKDLAAKGKTVFIITHDPELILESCEHIIQLDHGKILDAFPLSGNRKKLLQLMLRTH
jgi:energy-coupling factor transport system ATP-binding protein